MDCDTVRRLAVLFILVSVTVENTLSACTEAGLEKCEPNEGSKKTGTSGIGIPAGVTVAVFCSDHKSRLDACLDSFMQECRTEEEQLKLQAEGLKATYAHICGAGRSTMVQHQACLDSKAVEAGIDECGRRSDQIKPLTQTQICNNVLSLAGCFSSMVNATCGKDAASLYYEIFGIGLGPLQRKQLPNCNIKASLANYCYPDLSCVPGEFCWAINGTPRCRPNAAGKTGPASVAIVLGILAAFFLGTYSA